MGDTTLVLQRELARTALGILKDEGVALAGSSAIREHGLIARPTEDIDLFMASDAVDLDDPSGFASAADKLVTGLRECGYAVHVLRQTAYYLHAEVSKGGVTLAMDMGVDYRSLPPTRLEIGPILALEDAVGNKVAAVFSRGEARDYLDLDAIRQSARFDDNELLELAAKADIGFSRRAFAERLMAVSFIHPADVKRYGIDSKSLEELKDRLTSWGRTMKAESACQERH